MESHCPGLLAQICGVTLDLWRRSSLTAVGQPYALLTATILGNIAESDVQVVDIDGDPQTAGSSSQGRSLSDILSVPSKPPAFHIPKEYLPPEVYGLSAPTAPAYTASRSDLQALQEAALQLLGSLLFLTSVGRTQLMMALRPLLLRVKLTAVQAGPQLSLLLHSCDPLQSQLMVHMSHEVRGIIDVQEYSALLLRLASIANDSSHPLHVRQLSLLWFSSACERVERQKMGSVGGGQAVLPGVEALGWNWHVLLPGPMDEPQMVVMKTRTLVRILTAGVGDPEDVVTAIRELPGLWLSSPACATASAAIAAVLMLQRAHNLPEAMHLQLCSELGTLLLQVVRQNHRYVPLIDLLLGHLAHDGAATAQLTLLSDWMGSMAEELQPQEAPTAGDVQNDKVHADAAMGGILCLVPEYFSLVSRVVADPAIVPDKAFALLDVYARSMVRQQPAEAATALQTSMWTTGTELLAICRAAMLAHEPAVVLQHGAGLLQLMISAFPNLDVRDRSSTYLRLLTCLPPPYIRLVLTPPETQAEILLKHSRGVNGAAQGRPLQHVTRLASGAAEFLPLPFIADFIGKAGACSVGGSRGSSFSGGQPQHRQQQQHPAATRLQLELLPQCRRFAEERPAEGEADQGGEICAEKVTREYTAQLESHPPPAVQLPCRLWYPDRHGGDPLVQPLETLPLLSSDRGPEKYGGVAVPPDAIFGTEITFAVGEEAKLGGSGSKGSPRGDFAGISALHMEYLESGASSHSRELLLELEPRLPLPATLRPQVAFTDMEGEPQQAELQPLQLRLPDLFLQLPPHVSIPWGTIFEALWETFIAADEGSGAASASRDLDSPTEGWHSVCLVGTADSAAWWAAMTRLLQPFLVDSSAAGQPLPTTPGGRHAWGPQKMPPPGTDLAVVGMRAAIFLPPRHHLLLRLWAEADDGGVLAHVATDFWPALYHVDAWLAGGG
mmetsp:Transcript_6472/g.18065  ORF Transcript_6472/g.18065 Transcript_6472/m.18065 type:complete len:952 (-) Transcript_6472:155-3010(-)